MEVSKAVDFAEAISKMGAAMLAATSSFSLATAQIEAALQFEREEIEQQILAWSAQYMAIDWDALRDNADELNMEFGHWEAVSPKAIDRLDPDQRWEYQKWVWGAPVRWAKGLFARDE